MEIRDRLVAIVLAAGLLLGMAGWQAWNPLVGLGIGALALAAACVVYRLDGAGRPPRAGDRPGSDLERVEVSTRRPSPERP